MGIAVDAQRLTVTLLVQGYEVLNQKVGHRIADLKHGIRRDLSALVVVLFHAEPIDGLDADVVFEQTPCVKQPIAGRLALRVRTVNADLRQTQPRRLYVLAGKARPKQVREQIRPIDRVALPTLAGFDEHGLDRVIHGLCPLVIWFR